MTERVQIGFTASMQPILNAIGFDAALRLVSIHGGTRIQVREHSDGRDPVHAAIGAQNVRNLIEAIGAGPIDLPRCLSWLVARRNEEIAARYLGGETQVELAARFGLTERHIRRVLESERVK